MKNCNRFTDKVLNRTTEMFSPGSQESRNNNEEKSLSVDNEVSQKLKNIYEKCKNQSLTFSM
jgi:hypothetical protein